MDIIQLRNYLVRNNFHIIPTDVHADVEAITGVKRVGEITIRVSSEKKKKNIEIEVYPHNQHTVKTAFTTTVKSVDEIEKGIERLMGKMARYLRVLEDMTSLLKSMNFKDGVNSIGIWEGKDRSIFISISELNPYKIEVAIHIHMGIRDIERLKKLLEVVMSV